MPDQELEIAGVIPRSELNKPFRIIVEGRG
jgi:hypothetical protein